MTSVAEAPSHIPCQPSHAYMPAFVVYDTSLNVPQILDEGHSLRRLEQIWSVSDEEADLGLWKAVHLRRCLAARGRLLAASLSACGCSAAFLHRKHIKVTMSPSL